MTLPTVTHTGTIRVGSLEIRVHNLSDGTRAIEKEDFDRAMAWLAEGSEADVHDFANAYADAMSKAVMP